MKLKLYFEVKEPEEFGVSLEMGETARPIPYETLAGAVNKEALLRACGLDGVVKPEHVEVMTPEEYERKYGEEG